MRTLVIALAIGVLAAGVVLYFTTERTAAPQVAAGPSYVQRDQGEGGVEIAVTFVSPQYLASGGSAARVYAPEKFTVFLVAMNTHSVELSGYDLVKASELRAGGKIYQALRWVSTSDSSHHRSGALIFPMVDQRQSMELTIKAIAGVAARIFRWGP